MIKTHNQLTTLTTHANSHNMAPQPPYVSSIYHLDSLPFSQIYPLSYLLGAPTLYFSSNDPKADPSLYHSCTPSHKNTLTLLQHTNPPLTVVAPAHLAMTPCMFFPRVHSMYSRQSYTQSGKPLGLKLRVV